MKLVKTSSSFGLKFSHPEMASPKHLNENYLLSPRNTNTKEFIFESSVEKYNQKINIWQNYYLFIQKNYLYLYDKKPKFLSEIPKEYLFLNNKISISSYKKYVKDNSSKLNVVSLKYNYETLAKSSIEGNCYTVLLSFKSQKNYFECIKVIEYFLKNKIETVSKPPIFQKNREKSFIYKKIKKNQIRKNNSNLTYRNYFKRNINTQTCSPDKSEKITFKKLNISDNNNNNIFTFSKINSNCKSNNAKNMKFESSNNTSKHKENKKINFFTFNVFESNKKTNNIFDKENGIISSAEKFSVINQKNKKISRQENQKLLGHFRTKSCFEFSIKNPLKTEKEKINNDCSEIDEENSNNSNSNLNSLKSVKSFTKNGIESYEFNSNNKSNNEENFIYNSNQSSNKNENDTDDINNKSEYSSQFLQRMEIREQINEVVKSYEEQLEKENESETSNMIFTPRLKEEIQKEGYLSKSDSYHSEKSENLIESNKENNKENKDNNPISSIYSSITQVNQNKTNISSNNEIKDLFQELEKFNEKLFSFNEKIFTGSNDCINNNNNNDSTDDSKSGNNTNNSEISTVSINKRIPIPSDIFFNININYDEILIKDDNDEMTVEKLLYKIDNNLIFILDSSILNFVLKKIKIKINSEKIKKNAILGKIFENTKNISVRNFILCEMIAIICKKELSEIIINSIQYSNVQNKLKNENNENNFDEKIIKVFNKFLSRNKNNKDYKNLYENILAKEIKKLFLFDNNEITEGQIINLINKNVHPFTLYNSMQYHTKIYMNYDIDNFFNYKAIEPFQTNSISYISPTVLEKWKYKASLINNINNNSFDNTNSNSNININIKNPENKNKNNEKISESIDIQNDYSIDGTSNLSSIDFKNNKNEICLINNKNALITKNNINNKRNSIYLEYKQFDKNEEIQRISIFQKILFNLNQKDINLSINNCEYFLHKYKHNNLFLHPLIYLSLSILYNKKNEFENAKNSIRNALKYLTWLYPYKNNYLFYEIEYKYLLIVLNSDEEIIRNNIESINRIFAQCENLYNKYFNGKSNPQLKIQKCIFKLYYEFSENLPNISNILEDLYYENINPIMKEIEKNFLREVDYKENEENEEKKEKMKIFYERMKIYWKFFVDVFKQFKGCSNLLFNDLLQFLMNTSKSCE